MPTQVNKMKLLPWHQAAWQQFLQYYQQKRLPHALLITATPGVVHLQFAQSIAQLILCDASDTTQACGVCAGCQLLKSGNHPDYRLLQPENDSKVIKVDAIRRVNEQLTQRARQNGYKVIIINPADTLNVAASNALLKTLEEPTENTLIMLLSEHAQRLVPTLSSRCQRLTLTSTISEEMQEWLQSQKITDSQKWLSLSENAPLLAFEFATDSTKQAEYAIFLKTIQAFQRTYDPIITAASLITIDTISWCVWLIQFYMDLIRLGITNHPPFITHQNCLAELKKLSANYSLSTLFAAYDIVVQLYQLLLQPNNVNIQLQLEAALIDIIKLYQRDS